MIQPGRLDLDAYRYTPFVYQIDFPGYDFTSADFAAQVRAFPDAPGDPLIALTKQSSPAAEGIITSLTAQDNAPLSTLQLRINETTLEGLAFTAPRGGDFCLAWDLHITSTGLGKVRWLEGAFTLHAGVTQ